MMHYSMGIKCQKCLKEVTFYFKVEANSAELFPLHPEVREKINRFPQEWQNKALCNDCAEELGL